MYLSYSRALESNNFVLNFKTINNLFNWILLPIITQVAFNEIVLKEYFKSI